MVRDKGGDGKEKYEQITGIKMKINRNLKRFFYVEPFLVFSN